MGVFHSYFFGEDGISDLFGMSFNYGISLFPLPGAEVVEIRCNNEDPFSGNVSEPKKFGDPADPTLEERVFRFCFEFRDDLIYKIYIPKCVVPGKKRFALEN